MDGDLWKLKKRTNKKCPDCGKPLSIRERDGKEMIVCSFCDFEEHIQAKRIRKKEPEEEKIVEPRKTFRPTVRRNQ